MKSTLIFLAVFILGILAISYLYFFKEVPQQEVVEVKKYINIYTYQDTSLVKTGYRIYVGGVELKNGTTQTISGVRENIPSDRIITIENYNLEGQNFYISSKEIFTSNITDNYLAELNLIESGTFEIYDIENISSNNYVSVYIKSNGIIRNPGFCLLVSPGFLLINPLSKEVTPISLDRFINYDKCFILGDTILTEKEIEFEYLLFNELNNDKISFVFFDGDKINDKLFFDDDIGSPDFKFDLL